MDKKKKMILAGAGTAVGAMAVIMLIVWLIFGRGSIIGLWSIDGTTSYEFSKDGKGALVLPTQKYPFDYTLDEESKKVSIDFDDSSARDMTYTYGISWGKLTLTEAGGKSYVMKKQ